jgi:hypothetical protein
MIELLEDARIEAKGFEAPSCARESKKLMLAFLDKTIVTVRAYDEGTVQRRFEGDILYWEASDLWLETVDELKRIEFEED